MNKAQIAWLAAHPERSAEWLKLITAQGFDVHHCDENRANNEPENLILIERVDHMRLHDKNLIKPPCRYVDPNTGRLAYHAREQYKLPWTTIADKLGVGTLYLITKYAEQYARKTGLPWPLPEVKSDKIR
jgi:hypothetical protein